MEWDDEDGFGPQLDPEDSVNAINKNSRVVVLRHMFTLKELEQDASLLLDLKEDVREECASLGDVTNVVLYDVSELPSSLLSAHSHQPYLLPKAREGRRDDRQVPRPSQRAGLCSG